MRRNKIRFTCARVCVCHLAADNFSMRRTCGWTNGLSCEWCRGWGLLLDITFCCHLSLLSTISFPLLCHLICKVLCFMTSLFFWLDTTWPEQRQRMWSDVIFQGFNSVVWIVYVVTDLAIINSRLNELSMRTCLRPLQYKNEFKILANSFSCCSGCSLLSAQTVRISSNHTATP